MKINHLLLVIALLFCSEVLFAGKPGSIDREHWRNIKKGIRYDDSPNGSKYNRNWADKVEKSSGKKDPNSGFGKYSRNSVGKGKGNPAEYGENRIRTKEKDDPGFAPKISPPSALNLTPLAYIIIGIGILFLLYIIYMVIRQMDGKRNKKVADSNPDEEQEEPDAVELPKSELDQRLEAALAKGDHREAVRILFIFLIKALREKNWIHWEKKKTNAHYLNELSSNSFFNDFSKSVYIFELVWYGKRVVSKEHYLEIEPLFRKMIDTVEQNTGKP
ncbi:MAG TPA: hypothetical protein PK637_13135 [Flavobacteriales bacterium]|nr:hypothetical protein [Flavobacteriales bacterium]HRE97706.1 hypothetical protein [Flavobacteriales bacterium]HRJ39660.1 hypothetical protein [Flavobacteriales bacterium]